MVDAKRIRKRLAANQLPVVWLVARLEERGWPCTRQSVSNLLNGRSDGRNSQAMLRDAERVVDMYDKAMCPHVSVMVNKYD